MDQNLTCLLGEGCMPHRTRPCQLGEGAIVSWRQGAAIPILSSVFLTRAQRTLIICIFLILRHMQKYVYFSFYVMMSREMIIDDLGPLFPLF